MLWAAMPREVKDGGLAEGGVIEVASVDQELVGFGRRFGDDLPVGVDDEAAADQRVPILVAGPQRRLWNKRCSGPSASF